MSFDDCLYKDYKRKALSSGSLEYWFGNMRQCHYPVHKLKLAFYLYITDLLQNAFKWVEVFSYAKDLHLKGAYSTVLYFITFIPKHVPPGQEFLT